MSAPIGLILEDAYNCHDIIKLGRIEKVATIHGGVEVCRNGRWAIIFRHSSGKGGVYSLPHQINTLAHMAALKQLGAGEIIGAYSVGSLRPSLAPGAIVVVDDFICFNPLPTTLGGRRCHLTPCFSSRVRQNLVAAAWKAEVRFENGGVYWQSYGPRLETKAEIKMISHFADIVGMGMVTEASLAQEMGLEFAAVCGVTNFANGLSRPYLRDDDIVDKSRDNVSVIMQILSLYE